MSDVEYHLPDDSPLTDIEDWRNLMVASVWFHLGHESAWADGDGAQGVEYVYDLMDWILSFTLGGGGGGVQLEQSGELSSSATTIDITGIGSISANHLRLIVYARSTSNSVRNLRITLNDDTSNNMTWRCVRFGPSAVYGSGITTYAEMQGGVEQDDEVAGRLSLSDITIYDFANASEPKYLTGVGGRKQTRGQLFATWDNNAVVTKISLTPNSDDFKAGTKWELWSIV